MNGYLEFIQLYLIYYLYMDNWELFALYIKSDNKEDFYLQLWSTLGDIFTSQ